MKKDPYRFGKSSEALVTKHLKKKRYKILETNYRTRFGEIDIIARNRKTIVFVEVKARSSDRFGHPKEAVTPQKQHTMTRVAQQYLKQTGRIDAKARFDVVSVRLEKGTAEIEIIENAFDAAVRS